MAARHIAGIGGRTMSILKTLAEGLAFLVLLGGTCFLVVVL